MAIREPRDAGRLTHLVPRNDSNVYIEYRNNFHTARQNVKAFLHLTITTSHRWL